MSPSSFFRPELRSIVSAFTDAERRAAQIVLGFVGDYLKEQVREVDAEFVVPVGSQSESHTTAERVLNSTFRRPCGLVFLSATKAV